MRKHNFKKLKTGEERFCCSNCGCIKERSRINDSQFIYQMPGEVFYSYAKVPLCIKGKTK